MYIYMYIYIYTYTCMYNTNTHVCMCEMYNKYLCMYHAKMKHHTFFPIPNFRND